VVNYTGTADGKPVTEITPTAKGLTEQKAFWLEMGSTTFIPGFADQLLGSKAGDKRTVTVDFPADFVTPQLAGKKGIYEVEVVEVKEKILPAIDEVFAKSYGAEDLQKLRAGVRRDLENELNHKRERVIRNQLIRSLMNRVNFELPEGSVQQATHNAVYDIVQENAKRGVSRQTMEQQKEQIYAAAVQGAKERVKLEFLLQKIAEKEDIKVSQDEISARIATLAALYQIPPKKFLEDLQKRNALIEIYDQSCGKRSSSSCSRRPRSRSFRLALNSRIRANWVCCVHRPLTRRFLSSIALAVSPQASALRLDLGPPQPISFPRVKLDIRQYCPTTRQ